MQNINPLPTLRAGLKTVSTRWNSLAWALLGIHVVMLLLAAPLIGWLFREALRANGMLALDIGTFAITDGIGVTIALLVALMVVAFWLMSLQLMLLIIMIARVRAGASLQTRPVLRQLGAAARKLLRPSSAALFGYVLLVVPLSGFGFISTLSQGISIPHFVSGELLKSPVGSIIWYTFVIVLAFLNLRFALSIPIFVLTDATGGRALRQSWRRTAGWAGVRLILAIALIMIGAVVVMLAAIAIVILPTLLSDVLWPAASPVIAAFCLGVAEVLGMLVIFAVTAMLGTTLVQLSGTDGDGAGLAASPAADEFTVESTRRSKIVFETVCVVMALGLGAASITTMQQLSQAPETLVLGHRGFSDKAAENTIEGLEAAHAAGVDLVEIDVMQSKDGGFIVMHDTSLARLTGENVLVKDLTFDELTAMTVTDQFGHQGKIASLADYVTRANELEQPLLIEIKLSGAESDDHVDQLVAELENLDALEQNLFHTLDYPSAERLKLIRPDLTVGYILAFAGVSLPETSADFVVVEEFTASDKMQREAEAKGLGFYSWTVNDEDGIRELLRRGADGIITDHPDVAIAARAEMQDEKGLAGVLLDAITRFVIVW
ncbi:glycerophosphodiester phosphodiesterase [Leucobacter sp. cx-328]|uniref:glycerophosphodiester phosphodiesterase n=1 Tax=unclassified Leucobacter TaxID=2621730 RepID=UPI00165E4AB4|nr:MULTISPECIES: glycerophosphodiester phosphodiesterase [unclassified Leucobacter]MBC9942913.1 glycerophosphodiester phosphodiesterase [Leucobacter sp. cx-328]